MKDLFYRPIKVTDKDHNVFFWSDTHFGHECLNWAEPLWIKRGFKTLQEHDELLINRWQKNVSETATVFHLGDIIFGRDGEGRLYDILNRLTFRNLYLMPGNHQAGWKQAFEATVDGVYHLSPDKRVYFVPNYLEAVVNGQAIAMSHYAIASWNGQGKGSWMLHGHSHGSLHKGEIGAILYKSRIRDLGVECYPEPASFRSLQRELNAQETITFDHHDKHTLNPF